MADQFIEAGSPYRAHIRDTGTTDGQGNEVYELYITANEGGVLAMLSTGSAGSSTAIPAGGFVSTAATAFTVQFAASPANSPPNSRQVVFQNNTGATIYRSYTGTATANSFQIPAGQTWVDSINASSVSIYSAAALTLNGTAATLILEVF